MNNRVEVPPRLVRTAFRLGRDRNRSFEERDGYDIEIYAGNAIRRNIIGIIGELAFAEYADLQIDSGIYEHGDEGADFYAEVDGQGYTIDIKTRRQDPFALWVRTDRLHAEYNILGHLQAPVDPRQFHWEEPETLSGWEVVFLGAATKEELLDAKIVQSNAGHENYSILVEDLNPIPSPDKIIDYDQSL